MDVSLAILAMLAIAAAFAMAADTVTATTEEKALARQWVEGAFERPEAPPFSFIYDGKPSCELLGAWEHAGQEERLDRDRTQRTHSWTDLQTGLEARCVLITYRDFPTVEWTVTLRNAGTTDTPILEQIQALDARLGCGKTGEFLLHHASGALCSRDDYRPMETPLGPGAARRIGQTGGTPADGDLPYFNLEWGGEGAIIVVGWPGRWAAEFARDEGTGIHVRAGQELTHFRLHPGEEVRTPLIVLQFWKGGDWIRAQNVWRRWMVIHNLPRPGGKLPPPLFVPVNAREPAETAAANEEPQRVSIDRFLEDGLPLDYWWMDAGWYVNQTDWPNVGAADEEAPRGLPAVSDYAHGKAVKTVVWFEPERVSPGTWLMETHPEWLLGGTLLNLGNPEARQWLTDHVARMVSEQGIDTYRQDFDIDPLPFWRANDAEDRQGITEIGHVTGLLEYWDELQRRHPSLLIGTCTSGGRRNDLETLRRAVPLWRTDYPYQTVGTQSYSSGIALWIPYSGTGTCYARSASDHWEGPADGEAEGSRPAPGTGCGIDMHVKEMDYAVIRPRVAQWREHIAPDYFGDYYPLTPYSRERSVWLAWQLDRPEQGAGVVQAFRRSESPYESARLYLRGLSPRAEYAVTDLTTGKARTARGRELMEDGLLVILTVRPAVAVVAYQRQ